MRSFLLLVILAAASIPIIGQSKKSASGLKLTLEIHNDSVCSGESVQIFATLTNKGRKPTVVDPNGIAAFRIFDRVNRKTGKIDTGASFASESGRPSHYKPKYFVLKSGTSYSRTLETSIDREDFLSGKYRMQVGYKQTSISTFENKEVWNGIVYSNRVFLVVKNCEN